MTPVVRPTWLHDLAWPWPINHLQTPAGRIAVTDTGDGPTLLLSHVGMWSFLWRDLMLELQDRYRLVTFDAPGTGLSERVGASGTTIGAAAEAIGTLMDGLDLRDVCLVVHDIGGPAALAAAAGRADRISSIVAVNTFGWRPSGAAFRTALGVVGSAPVREFDAFTRLLPAAASTRFGAGRNWSAADRRVFRAAFDRPACRAVHRYLGDARRGEEVFDRVESALRGPLADRRVVTVFGERNDPLGLQPGWKARFPDAVQHVVAKGYHFPMCDAPAQVAGWIRELSQRPA